MNANVAITRNGDAFMSQWELRLHISAFEDNPQLNVNILHWRNYKERIVRHEHIYMSYAHGSLQLV